MFIEASLSLRWARFEGSALVRGPPMRRAGLRGWGWLVCRRASLPHGGEASRRRASDSVRRPAGPTLTGGAARGGGPAIPSARGQPESDGLGHHRRTFGGDRPWLAQVAPPRQGPSAT